MERHTLENKLYVLRNVEGDPNINAINIIRGVHSRLEQNPAFVGLALRGSVTRGYFREGSDIDLFIIYDSSIGLVSETTDYFFHQSSIRQKILKDFMDAKEYVGLSIKSQALPSIDIFGIGAIRGGIGVIDISPQELTLRKIINFPSHLGNLFRLTTGKRIDYYRDYWVEELRKLTKKDCKMITEAAAWGLASEDAGGWDKMTYRIHDSQLLKVSSLKLGKNFG